MNDILIYSPLLLSAVANVVFIFLYFREKRRPSKKQSSSADLDEFIADLLQGEALVKITRIAPNDVFLRSPRHGRQ